MPDWVVHVAVAWSLCRILRFKYPQFNQPNTVLVMVGSVFPDALKVSILFELMGQDWWDYIYVVHLPIGSFLLAGIASLLFQKKKEAFLFLSLGIITHYALDLLLIQMGYGMYLFYPASWMGFTVNLVPNDDYYITIVALFIALVVYVLSEWKEKKIRSED
ncbi:MAG: metal-dependent hydrolase [Methanobacterium sp.]|jgi:branched-subunit amino acid transport protein AzlD|nr:metal-dependent hydrolase [Methanobacterium sp.]